VRSALQVEEKELLRIRRLTEVSRALTYATSLDEVFQLTVDRAADLLAAEKALLLLANDDGLLGLRSSYGVDAGLANRFREPLNETLVMRLAGLLDAQPESFLGVPLVVSGAVKGILVVIRQVTTSAAEQDEWLLSARIRPPSRWNRGASASSASSASSSSGSSDTTFATRCG
jgi:phosphoserine phosphatase RsbU/P